MPVFDKDDNMLMIEVPDVFCVYREVKTRRIVVIAECGEYYLPTTIKQISAILGPSGFQQIDKNKIINVAKVKRYKNGKVTLDGSTFTVSRRNRKPLEDKLN